MDKSDNLNCCFLVVLLFWICISSNILFFWVLDSLIFYVIVYRQSDYGDRKFGACNHEIYSCCFIMMFYQYKIFYSQCIKFYFIALQRLGKSRYLQKLLRYLREIVNSVFKFSISGCAGWFLSPEFLGCGCPSGVPCTFFYFKF